MHVQDILSLNYCGSGLPSFSCNCVVHFEGGNTTKLQARVDDVLLNRRVGDQNAVLVFCISSSICDLLCGNDLDFPYRQSQLQEQGKMSPSLVSFTPRLRTRN